MFDSLTEKLEATFKKLRGHGSLTESNIKDALKEIRRALLEADVNYKVTRDFIKEIEQEAIGIATVRSVEPGQHVVKVVHDHMVKLLGDKTAEIRVSEHPPSVIMICVIPANFYTTRCAEKL